MASPTSTTTLPLTLTLPWPPTVNHYWVPSNGKLSLTKAGRVYKDNAMAAIIDACNGHIATIEIIQLVAVIELYNPCGVHNWDVDNRAKAVLDALEKSRVVKNDSQFRAVLLIDRGVDEARGPGRAVVTIARNIEWEAVS
ncbi:MAG: RusA family crossover junction endodeoxyribonuclease [Planctomycetota bacterium]|nr:RusA family crossover junction endodeoxyribonuclease [Planctomycetota bacterium]